MAASLLVVLGTALAVAKAPKDPCRGSEVGADAFTGEQTTRYKALMWSTEHAPQGTSWTIKVAASGAVDAELAVGWPIDLKLDDGTIMRLATTMPTPPQLQATQYAVTTSWMARFSIDPEAVHQLAASPVALMRLDVGKGPLDWDTNAAFRANVMEAFACIASMLPPSAPSAEAPAPAAALP